MSCWRSRRRPTDWASPSSIDCSGLRRSRPRSRSSVAHDVARRASDRCVRQRPRRPDRRAGADRSAPRRATSSTSATPVGSRTGRSPPKRCCKYSFEITDRLLDRRVKMLVVACNSASAAALDALQRARRRPGHRRDRRPASAPRGRSPQTGRVGVIGTVGTISSGAYQRARPTSSRPDIVLTCAACPGFVEFVEAGDVDSDQVHVLAERLLAPVRDAERRHARARVHALPAARRARSATSWVPMSCSSRAPTRPRSRCAQILQADIARADR